MNFLSLIEAKRDGHALAGAELQQLVRACTDGTIPDYQLAAFLMAVLFRGLNEGETRALTLAMRDSGETLAFPDDPRPLVDKHSTGGVGDKVSLVLTPLLACLGFRVPMISGRGLGITGGTLDKLESIPGFQTVLPRDTILENVQRVGCVICGQTEAMVPADKRLYALRDVTGTVPSIPLIVASILSKKLAENLGALVLDVKFGAAAFMPSLDAAGELARAMVTLANGCGVKTRALLTRMDAPLGRSAGNWLEVKEAADLLGGTKTVVDLKDLRELVLQSAAHLLVLTGKSKDLSLARQEALECLNSGRPRDKWEEMLRAQGGDLELYKRKLRLDSSAAVVKELRAGGGGFVSKCDARIIGEVVRDLGGGRITKELGILPEVGLDRIAKAGEFVQPGSVLARVHADEATRAEAAVSRLASAFGVSPEPASECQIIAGVVEG